MAAWHFDESTSGRLTNQIAMLPCYHARDITRWSKLKYVSEEQCIVRQFFSEEFSPCPVKCIPIQMKGLRYVNKSNSSIVENCTRLEDELCNGGPTVWSRFNKTKVGSLKMVWLLDHSSKLNTYFFCSWEIKDCYRWKCILYSCMNLKPNHFKKQRSSSSLLLT